MTKRVIVSLSSDIGAALALAWMDRGHEIVGTFRTETETVLELRSRGAQTVYCDLSDTRSVNDAVSEMKLLAENWEVLVQAAGTQDPIGPFETLDFDEWEQSIAVNFTSQLRLTHGLSPFRDLKAQNGPMVLFFAGGATNNATVNYSSYTISKIALIKMCELLDAEVPDTRFTIIGPGWVKTKIHESTLKAPDQAGANYDWTVAKMSGSDMVPMVSVVECCDWVISSPRDVVSGRNFSLVYDEWPSPKLDAALRADNDMYKLRRSGNHAMTRAVPVTEQNRAND